MTSAEAEQGLAAPTRRELTGTRCGLPDATRAGALSSEWSVLSLASFLLFNFSGF